VTEGVIVIDFLVDLAGAVSAVCSFVVPCCVWLKGVCGEWSLLAGIVLATSSLFSVAESQHGLYSKECIYWLWRSSRRAACSCHPFSVQPPGPGREERQLRNKGKVAAHSGQFDTLALTIIP